MTDPNKSPQIPYSFGRTPEEKALRVHNLKHCDKCGNDSDPMGGVEMKAKWYCAKCWVKFISRR